MMNSAPAVVGVSDGLATFRSIIAKKGTRSCDEWCCYVISRKQ